MYYTIQCIMPCYKVFISLLRGFHALSFPEFRAPKAEWKLKLLRGPAWRHPRSSSWSPSRLTFGCFDSMEVKSRFVLKMTLRILTESIYYTLSTVAWDILDLIDFTMSLIFLLLGMIYIAKVSHFHFLDIGIIGERRSICTTRYSVVSR